jgi:SEC-C motif-containing protein
MTDKNICPCNSGKEYDDCCKPFLQGTANAPTATALMRSRYTAFAKGDIAYLLKTWHPSTRPSSIDPETIPEWCGLQIVRSEKGNENDALGVVEFKASAMPQGRLCLLHETSRFVKKDGQWLYVDGDIKDEPPLITKVAKVGRNEPCPCGSGKKSKRCCRP